MEENELISVDNNNAVEYTDDNIRHLSDMEHVRTRPGMYIGRLGDGAHAEDGIYVLLKEVIDNSIDEFKMQAGKKIEITVEENLRVSVRDYGRGIPTEPLSSSNRTIRCSSTTASSPNLSRPCCVTIRTSTRDSPSFTTVTASCRATVW